MARKGHTEEEILRGLREQSRARLLSKSAASTTLRYPSALESFMKVRAQHRKR